MLRFIENVDQIIENIKTLENYLNSEDPYEQEFARDLVKKGRSMIIYKVDGRNHFAPIRFMGYRNNTKTAYLDNETKEPRDAAPAIQSVLGKPFTHEAIEKEFNEYASAFKGNTLKSRRKYWRVRGEDNKYFDLAGQGSAVIEEEIVKE
jgi:hypothetical protein